jgi:hypothetical protein
MATIISSLGLCGSILGPMMFARTALALQRACVTTSFATMVCAASAGGVAAMEGGAWAIAPALAATYALAGWSAATRDEHHAASTWLSAATMAAPLLDAAIAWARRRPSSASAAASETATAAASASADPPV